MAREPSVLDGDDAVADGHRGTIGERESGSLHRRSYLKLAGATVASAAAATAAPTAVADEDDYTVYELSAGERRVFEVGDGETFENVLIDCTAGGCYPVVAAHGTNWTIRNVGIKGRIGDADAVFGVSDRGGNTSTIENVYLGDGATGGHRHGLGLWVAPEHTGHIDIRNVNIQEMGDNSFYCSAPGASGTVHIDGCYSANSWVSHFRLAQGKVTNSVAVNDERHKDGRGVWCWAPGEVEIDGCQLAMNGRHYAVVGGANGQGSTVTIRNTDWDDDGVLANGGTINEAGGNGSNPEDVVPDDCPTSAEEAASGGSGTDSGGSTDQTASDEVADESDLPNTLVVEGSAEAATRYEFAVSGSVEASTAEGATADDEDVIDDGTVHGVVANWADAFRFDGELESLSVDGPATVTLDGEVIDPFEYGGDLPHVLAVEGDGSPASFEITVDGSIAYAGDGDPVDEATVVSGSTVQGSVADGVRRFRFSGTLADVSFASGEAAVTVDGEAVDPAACGDQELLPHAVVFDGTDADGRSTYAFEATGSVVRSGYRDASIDANDVVEGRAVRGSVANGRDAYWFDGHLEDVTVRGDADVRVAYNVRKQ